MPYITKSRTVKFIFTLTALALTFFITPFFSKAVPINIGPALGDKAPVLSVINTNKQAVTINDLTGNKGLIILFFRSADWCPFCKRHLLELNEYADKFKALGYGLSAISYDSTDVLNQFSKEENISYPLLSDQAAATISAYKILNPEYRMGDEHYGIPAPGVVIINSEGKVAYKYFFEGYVKRVEFSELYMQLSNVK